jgi:hypothetical protein
MYQSFNFIFYFFNFNNPLNPNGWVSKFLKYSSLICFRKKKKKKRNCKDLDVGQDLTQFVKILIP